MFIGFSYFSFFLLLFFFCFGVVFSLVGFVFGGGRFFSCFFSQKVFECGFMSVDGLVGYNVFGVYDLVLLFVVLELELVMLSLFVVFFSYSSFLVVGLFFVVLSFVVLKDLWFGV